MYVERVEKVEGSVADAARLWKARSHSHRSGGGGGVAEEGGAAEPAARGAGEGAVTEATDGGAVREGAQDGGAMDTGAMEVGATKVVDKVADYLMGSE